MQSEEISKLEIFSSFADNVIVMKISSGKKGSLNFNMNATTPHIKKSIFTKKSQLIINGTSGSVNNRTDYKHRHITHLYGLFQSGKFPLSEMQIWQKL